MFKRGNEFNKKARDVYDYNEIVLENGKRLDSYIPGKEIKAMVNAGIPEDVATGWVVKGLEDLQAKGEVKVLRISRGTE